MEIVDENPDSDEAMIFIAEQLLEELKCQEYVILLGDGKTYEHLMNIKRLYGPELSFFLVIGIIILKKLSTSSHESIL